MLVIELDQRTDGRDIKQYLGQITGATTVPRWVTSCMWRARMKGVRL